MNTEITGYEAVPQYHKHGKLEARFRIATNSTNSHECGWECEWRLPDLNRSHGDGSHHRLVIEERDLVLFIFQSEDV